MVWTGPPGRLWKVQLGVHSGGLDPCLVWGLLREVLARAAPLVAGTQGWRYVHVWALLGVSAKHGHIALQPP